MSATAFNKASIANEFGFRVCEVVKEADEFQVGMYSMPVEEFKGNKPLIKSIKTKYLIKKLERGTEEHKHIIATANVRGEYYIRNIAFKFGEIIGAKILHTYPISPVRVENHQLAALLEHAMLDIPLEDYIKTQLKQTVDSHLVSKQNSLRVAETRDHVFSKNKILYTRQKNKTTRLAVINKEFFLKDKDTKDLQIIPMTARRDLSYFDHGIINTLHASCMFRNMVLKESGYTPVFMVDDKDQLFAQNEFVDLDTGTACKVIDGVWWNLVDQIDDFPSGDGKLISGPKTETFELNTPQ
jgi:hypothetical protein